MLRLAVVVPTYNEVNNITTLIEQVAEVARGASDVDTTVIVIDDSSPDGTGEAVEALVPQMEAPGFTLRLLRKTEKAGLGAAYIYGFRTLLAEDAFDYFLQMDADLSHDPRYIAGFIHQAKEGADFVVASRYIKGGGTPDWSLRRRLLSRGGNMYARALLSRSITDYTGGFNMYSAPLLRRVRPDKILASGYGYLLDLKYRALKEAGSIVELPIVFLDRTHGSSKIPRNTIIKSFLLVPRLRLGHREASLT